MGNKPHTGTIDYIGAMNGAANTRADMKLPDVYIEFYNNSMTEMQPIFVGSDLINDRFDLKAAAIDLLKENGLDNFLDDDDYVFMMHQGYQFYYFKANGDPNPDVFGYTEVDNEQRNYGSLKDFLRKDSKTDRA